MSVSVTGDVRPSLQLRDLAYESAEHKEAEDVPNEVFEEHFGVHPTVQEENRGHSKSTGQIPIEDELRKWRLQRFGHVQRMGE